MIELNRKELFAKLNAGIQKIYTAVAATFGPNGKNVIIQDRNGTIKVTKDGVTVANAVHSDDSIEQIGIEMIRQAANTSVKNTGDGTSTTTILASTMVNTGASIGINDVDKYKKEANAVLEKVKNLLKEKVINPTEEIIYNVALTSSNNDESIARIVADTVNYVGKEGSIIVKIKSNQLDYSSELVNGYTFKRGYESSRFINDNRNGTLKLGQTLVALIDKKLDRFEEVLEIVAHALKQKKALLIVAEEFSSNFINNCLKNDNIIPVKLPEFGSHRQFYLDDLAIYTKAAVNNNSIVVSNLGEASGVTMTKDSTSITRNTEEDNLEISQRLELLQLQISEAKDEFTEGKLKDRLHQMNGKSAIIYVGGNNPLDMVENKDLVDDAVGACISAIKNGILPGAGKALFYASHKIAKEGNDTEKIILFALRQPSYLINSAIDDVLEPFETGYDARQCKMVNLVEQGIVDSYETVINCLENSVSVSTSILCSECLIIQE